MTQLLRNLSLAILMLAIWSGAHADTAQTSGADSAGSAAIREWTFTDDDTGGWRLGWNTSDESAVTDLDTEPSLGLKLTLNFKAAGWGDSNLKVAWAEAQMPVALNMRVLVPISAGKPKGPLQVGCAMNDPSWSEAKHWTDLKMPDRVSIGGKDYFAQNVTCRLGESDVQRKTLVLRLGGDHVRFNGTLYIQNIRALGRLN